MGSLDRRSNAIRKLNPTTIIAGHKKPEMSHDANAILDGKEAYIRDFSKAVASANTARDVTARMCDRYPDYPNVIILRMSADSAVNARQIRRSSRDVEG